MPIIEGAILDYNRTASGRHGGYHEIAASYALLGKAIRDARFGRALRLLGPLQYKCWKLTLAGRLDEVVDVFSNEVLIGEDAEYVERFARDFDINKSGWKWALGLPKIGKKMDTTPVWGAVQFAQDAHKAGVKTAVYSGSFLPFIEANLERAGYRGAFDVVRANSWVADKGVITGADWKVDCREKGRGFREFLREMRLRENGEAVFYAGDDEPDVSVFRQVEYPVVPPTAKPEFAERCRSDPEFGHRVVVLAEWEEARERYLASK